VRPEITAYHLARCRCVRCGRTVRARHPNVPEDQRGATAHRIGPRARAIAHWLHYQMGVPVRKVPPILQTLLGIPITQGALTQDALRQAEGPVGEAHQGLRAEIAREPVIWTDDTGWKVGGRPAHLMAFASFWTTVFQIRSRHRNEEVREVVPADYRGVLTTGSGALLRRVALARVKQQKCLAHIQRSLSEALVGQRARGRWFARRLKRLLRQAVALWEQQQAGTLSPETFAAARDRLVATVTEHLRPRPLRNDTRGAPSQRGTAACSPNSGGITIRGISCASSRGRGWNRPTTGRSGPCGPG